MSAISVSTHSLHDSLGARLEARATRLDRLMLHAALAVEASVARRLERRADAASDAAAAVSAADERRRDLAAAAHSGLMPR